jgi:hypothetical protein
MKWTFKGVKNAFTPTGKPITVTEYELYMDSRGNPKGSKTTQYYEGEVFQDKSAMGQYAPPKAKELKLGKDFVLENPIKSNVGGNMLENPIKSNVGGNMTDKKWILYGIVAVIGYFAYKKFKK